MSGPNGHPNGHVERRPVVDDAGMSELDVRRAAKDAELVHNHIKRNIKRWRWLDDDLKKQVIDGARMSLSEVDQVPDPKDRIDCRNATSKLIVAIEGQHQKDEHAERELEAGAAPKEHVHRHFIVKPPRVLGGGE